MRIDHEKNIGKVINSLKIESSKKQGKYYFYHCICECGNEKDIRADHILSGYIKSCGCKRKNEKYKNLENIKFNKLLVKSIYKKRMVEFYGNVYVIVEIL